MDPDDKPLDEPRSNEGDSFYRRWSERKLASQQPLIVEEPIAEALLPGDGDTPPLESLDETSDYQGFLSPRVSEPLRKLALRKLFHSSDFNVCDGLDDYAEDFTQFEVLGDLITADMRHRLEQEAQRGEEQALMEEQSMQQQSASNTIEPTQEDEKDGNDRAEEQLPSVTGSDADDESYRELPS
jgi:hypothetical protein